MDFRATKFDWNDWRCHIVREDGAYLGELNFSMCTVANDRAKVLHIINQALGNGNGHAPKEEENQSCSWPREPECHD